MWHPQDLLILGLAVLLFWQVRPVPSLCDFREDYLSPSTTTAWKGVFALCIVMHHICLNAGNGAIFFGMKKTAFMAVSYFFFVSGYGLQTKFRSDPSSRRGFLRRRVPRVLCPYLSAAALYLVLYAATGRLPQMLATLLGAETFVPYSWFVLVTLGFYPIFALLMQLFSRRTWGIVPSSLVLLLLWVVLCEALGLGSWWYNSCLGLVFGLFWAEAEDTLLPWVRKFYWLLLLLAWWGAAWMYSVAKRVSLGAYEDRLLFSSDVTAAVFQSLSGVFFVFGIMLLCMKVKFGNPALDFLGGISFEIYLCQGIWIWLLRSEFFYITDDFFWSCTVCLATVATAWGLHRILFLSRQGKRTRRQSSSE